MTIEVIEQSGTKSAASPSYLQVHLQFATPRPSDGNDCLMMDEFDTLLATVRSMLPAQLRWTVGVVQWLLVLGLLYAGLRWLKGPLSALTSAFGRMIGSEARRDAVRHRIFVDSLLSRLEQINANAEWTDRRYAELDAQVETRVKGHPRSLKWVLASRRAGLRREYLSEALRKHQSQFLLLQGPPGSGKSVALRHIGIVECRRALGRGPWKRPVPLYVNLRDFKPTADTIGAEQVREYILSTLTSLNDARQIRYLRENFDGAIEKGKWLFLFDGFDEVPEVLAAVQINATIKRYAEALHAFATDVGSCRSIIASREYRGPEKLDWPRLEIVGLNEERKRAFIKKADLDSIAEDLVLENLPLAGPSIQQLADNPMFLGLVTEHVETERKFPSSSHEVFETHARRALRETEIESSFEVAAKDIRDMAEEIAYCMSADKQSGLSATVREIAAARERLSMPPRALPEIQTAIKILTYVRITRTDETFMTYDETPISFSHRRFQEYFATCYVLDRHDLVSPRELMLNGRWRETAVTILQTQEADVVEDLLNEAATLLKGMTATGGSVGGGLERFAWPSQALHVLGILDNGIGSPSTSSHPVVGLTEDILRGAVSQGIIVDKKWALDVAGPVRSTVMVELLRGSLRTGSEWLRETAFKRMRHISPLPTDISRELAFALVTFSVGGRLRRDRLSMRAQIANLSESAKFFRVLWLLNNLPRVDIAVHVLLAALLVEGSVGESPIEIVIGLALASHLLLYMLRGTSGLSWSAATSKFDSLFAYLRRFGQGDSVLVGYLLMVARLLVLSLVAGILTGSALWQALLVTIVLYALSWAPACLIAIRLDAGSSAWLLVVLPQIVATKFAVFWLAQVVRKSRRQVASIVLIVAISAIVILASGFYLSRLPEWGVVLLGGLFVAALLVSLAGILHTVILLSRDRWTLRVLLRKPPAQMNSNDFVQVLRSVKSSSVTTQAVEALRENGSFRDAGGLLIAMQDLAWAIDAAREDNERRRESSRQGHSRLKGKKAENRLFSEQLLSGMRTPAMQSWMEGLGPKGPSVLKTYGPRMTDELGRSIEQGTRVATGGNADVS